MMEGSGLGGRKVSGEARSVIFFRDLGRMRRTVLALLFLFTTLGRTVVDSDSDAEEAFHIPLPGPSSSFEQTR